MTTLAESREEVRDVLASVNVPSFSYMPERVTPPVAVLKYGSPYMEGAGRFGHYLLRYEVGISVGTGTNETITAALDSLLDDAVIAFLQEDSMNVETVSEVYGLEINGTTYLTADLVVTNEIQL